MSTEKSAGTFYGSASLLVNPGAVTDLCGAHPAAMTNPTSTK